ncbi:MAG: endonuclease [Bacteroidaceae bacterium]|nr:endonuclease [Bacteroidaceae bacterium]
MTLLLAAVAMCTFAAAPNSSGDYYRNADGKKGAALKTALCGIIQTNIEKSYDYLWTAFRTTDKRSDGKVWDMYSNITNYTFGTDQAGNFDGENQKYNREHSFPKSWFGGEVGPMYTDLHHMYPTDGFVNNKRDNYPFGEVGNASYSSANGFSKLGTCSVSGYSGTVFEPNDEYKGDFARTYFYMVTRYEEKLPDWYSNYSDSRATLDGNTYPGLKAWQLSMLLAWAADDPVSQKETARNNAVYGIQGNRNPFIDYPGLEQYIWGSKTNEAFSYDNYDGGSSSGGQGGDTPAGDTYVKVTSADDLTDGQYLIVYEGGSLVFDGSLTSLDATKNTQSVTISGNAISASATVNASAFTITAISGGYSIKSASGYYIGNTSDSNGLSSSTTQSYTNAISFDGDGNANIKSSGGAYLRYNATSGQERFRYFKSSTYTSQKAIQLYKFVEAEQINPTTYSTPTTVPYGSSFTLVNGTHFTTDGSVTLSSSNEAVATVDGLTVTPVAVGECIISVTYGEGTDYNSSNSVFIFTVTQPEGKTEAYVAESTETLDFTSNSWDLPTTGTNTTKSYTNAQGYTVTLTASSSYYYNAQDKYLILGKSGSTLTLPAFDKAVTRIDVIGRTGASSKVKQNIYVGNTSVSTETTGSTGTNSYIIDESHRSAGTVYTLQVTNAYNTQITSIIVHFATNSLTTNLNASGYATYCSEYPLDFTDAEDYSAWQITGVNGTAITFEQVTGKVKGGTGLLLKGEPGATIALTSAASDNVLDGNLLEGTLAPTYVEADAYYGLSGQTFVKVNPGTAPKGKALLPASAIGDSNVKVLAFSFDDDATGIETIDNGQQTTDNGVIYNLAGQRLQKLQRGINIVNGKKVLRR